MIRSQPLRRTRPKARRSKPRKGRVIDRAYLRWVHTQPCIVSGERKVTAHHVRFCGSPKDDRRTVPLAARFHMYGFGNCTVEHGKRVFEERYGVSLEDEIVRLNRLYGERPR